MMLSLGVSLCVVGLLTFGWAVRLNRRVRPPRWLFWWGDYYAAVVVILLTLGTTLGVRELVSGQVTPAQAGGGVLIGIVGYGLWRLVRRLEKDKPVLRVVEADIVSVPSNPSNGASMNPAQTHRAA